MVSLLIHSPLHFLHGTPGFLESLVILSCLLHHCLSNPPRGCPTSTRVSHVLGTAAFSGAQAVPTTEQTPYLAIVATSRHRPCLLFMRVLFVTALLDLAFYCITSSWVINKSLIPSLWKIRPCAWHMSLEESPVQVFRLSLVEEQEDL